MQSQTMTDLLQKVVAETCDLPVEIQDEIARLVIAHADDLPRVFRLGEDEDPGLDASRALPGMDVEAGFQP